MADINGINVAFLAYTCDTNSVPVAGFEYAASICALDYLSGGTKIDYDLMQADISSAREAGADIVFVFMSWGIRVCHGAQRAAGRDCRFPL